MASCPGDPINHPKLLLGKCNTDIVSCTGSVSVFLLQPAGPLWYNMVTMQKRDDYDLWTKSRGNALGPCGLEYSIEY